jgi:hypothetical protein
MYKLHKNLNDEVDVVVRLTDNACIPFDEANTDYQAYLAWLEQGNEPLPAENT